MITSTSNQQMKQVSLLLKKSKERKNTKSFVVEGPRMVVEASVDALKAVYVAESYADKVVFENTAISNVTLANTNSGGYALHAFVYYDGENCFNEAEGGTVTNCTFVSK